MKYLKVFGLILVAFLIATAVPESFQLPLLMAASQRLGVISAVTRLASFTVISGLLGRIASFAGNVDPLVKPHSV